MPSDLAIGAGAGAGAARVAIGRGGGVSCLGGVKLSGKGRGFPGSSSGSKRRSLRCALWFLACLFSSSWILLSST